MVAPLPLEDVDVMILAAGFGQRMRPLTEAVPKPLLPVLGRPLLAWNLRVLASLGARRIVINAHHRSDLLEAFLEEELDAHFRDPEAPPRPETRLVREPVILGTAGGIANAGALLRTDPCLIWNVDLLYRPDLSAALQLHRSGAPAATLVLTKSPLHAKVELDGTRVVRVREEADPSDSGLRAYTGVLLLSQAALQELPRGGFSELPPFLRSWAEGRRLFGHDDEALFLEVGTLEGYLRVHRRIAELPSLLPGPAPEGIALVDGFGYVDRRARVAANATLEDSLVLPGGTIEAGVRIRRSIVGPRAVARGEVFGKALAGEEEVEFPVLDRELEARLAAFLRPHQRIWPREARKLPRSFLPLHGDGSGRRLVRIVCAAHSHIAIVPAPAEAFTAASGDGDGPLPIYPVRRGPGVPTEPDTFVYVAGILRSRQVRVPEIRAHDEEDGLLLVEDLGDTLLLDAVNAGDPDRIRALYRTATDLLGRLRRPEGAEFDPEKVMSPSWTPEFARTFEVGYFEREMVVGWAGLEPAGAALEAEYEEIVRAAIGHETPVLVHRDFQSRNLMVLRDGLAVIDFQGARLGPPLYDLASLLYDPYAEIGEELRAELREEFFERARISEAGRETFVPVALSRLLQALGAFAFLGARRGRPGFLEHAPRALERVGALSGERFPHLRRLSDRLRERFPGSTSRPDRDPDRGPDRGA